MRLDLQIAWRGLRCVVVEKPSGLLSVREKGPDKEDCVPARVRQMIPTATGPMVVHRLDMDTSGLLVVALDAHSQRDLSLQFENRKIFKRYVALLDGHLPLRHRGVDHESMDPDDSTCWPLIDCPIRLDPGNRPMQIHDPVHGKPSRTRYRLDRHATLISPSGRRIPVTRTWFEPLTGRSHQLRVHAAFDPKVGALGCPIAGDPLYNPRHKQDPDHPPRLMLHACALGFTEPGTDRWTIVRSEPDWGVGVEGLGGRAEPSAAHRQ
ncbi:MAG: RluA family pseudouridine synthase [Phycisphaerales bacterium]